MDKIMGAWAGGARRAQRFTRAGRPGRTLRAQAPLETMGGGEAQAGAGTASPHTGTALSRRSSARRAICGRLCPSDCRLTLDRAAASRVWPPDVSQH